MRRFWMILTTIAASTISTAHTQSLQIGMIGNTTAVKTEQKSGYNQTEYGIEIQKELHIGRSVIVGASASFGEQQFAYGMHFLGNKQTLDINSISLSSWSASLPVLTTWHLNERLQLNAGVAFKLTSLTLTQNMAYSETTEPITINGETIAGSALSSDLDRSTQIRSLTILPTIELNVNLPLHLNLVLGSAWQPTTSVSLNSEVFSSESGFQATLPAITHKMQGLHFYSGIAYRF
jgi:hypothetical protein